MTKTENSTGVITSVESEDQAEISAGPCVTVIFGATGDLAARKLMPAIYNLAQNRHLSSDFAIVGMAREEMTTAQFRDLITERVHKYSASNLEPAIWDWIIERTYYVAGNFDDPVAYTRLSGVLEETDKSHRTGGNYLYYLATSPAFFGKIVTQLGVARLACPESSESWRRVVIEKPFGRDLDSAKALNREIKKVLAEEQIYRIDHYLGKETVQNIMAFRFGNGIFEPVWNRRYVDHVQITVAETVGVEQRGGYFEHAGTLRDMVPNHIFQLITLTAMEPPVSFSADAVRTEQAKVLAAMQPLTSEDVLSRAIRGQYGPSGTGSEAVRGYRSELDVAPDSKTETFVALKLMIDNWRWADVPFYVRTGKRMATRHSEVAILFKSAPFVLFRHTPVHQLKPNLLIMHIAPDEGVSLRFGAKIPGPLMRLGPVDMNFEYSDYFGSSPSTGYEVLLYDAMIGDATLFQSTQMVEAGWKVVDPVLDVWSALPSRNFPNYSSGTWGPKESQDLLERDGRAWRNVIEELSLDDVGRRTQLGNGKGHTHESSGVQ